jgi:hypothetical protein
MTFQSQQEILNIAFTMTKFSFAFCDFWSIYTHTCYQILWYIFDATMCSPILVRESVHRSHKNATRAAATTKMLWFQIPVLPHVQPVVQICGKAVFPNIPTADCTSSSTRIFFFHITQTRNSDYLLTPCCSSCPSRHEL